MTREREELIRLLDGMHVFCSAAFYSDPDVETIVERLYQRWESSGRRGEPLDHAVPEELQVLLRAARRYASMPPWQAYRLVEERRLRRGEEGAAERG